MNRACALGRRGACHRRPRAARSTNTPTPIPRTLAKLTSAAEPLRPGHTHQAQHDSLGPLPPSRIEPPRASRVHP